ncbi:two-component sensor histidine kinase [Gracilibacillus boraciitolerans JCM 21714]|uniref:Two-component sensor histidine kinase n=1 Tax=Gracilibacillus boraciitolerans JCM 21714 TaxID=1298598 RepID=W4VGP8_9BACI|nr:sensor histidine kinase [Gracilibacillus boraciitolerans]GAE91983.1 two-component sensor histidine kinase [Gracilibacillus boraciitolerans JCM 21714]
MDKFHLNNIKIKNKLLLIYMFSVFLPIVLTNVIFYYVTSENVRNQKIHDNELALRQVTNSFKQGVEDAVGIASVLYSDAFVYQFLDKNYESPLDFILAYNSQFRDINKFTPIYSSIRSINLFTDNPTVIKAGGIYDINEDVINSHWYQSTIETRKKYPVVTRRIEDDVLLDQFVVVRALDSSESVTNEKVIMINLNERFIHQIFSNETFEGEIFLLNENNTIEFSTDESVPWSAKYLSFNAIDIPDNAIILEESYQMQYMSNWKLVGGVIPEDKLLTEVRKSIPSILYLALWNFVIPTLFIIYLAGNIHFRLNTIVKKMRKVKNQNFELIEGKLYKDEIGVLTTEFNRMSKKIKDLINDVYVVKIQKKDLEIQKKETQLKALQSQINPHFLFNVLETLRMRSLLKEEIETADIIQNMAKLLRNSITWNKDFVTVKEEVQLIKAFLEIQKYRFDEKIQYEIYLSKLAEDSLIPNMIIIPFIENASIHGIEPLKANGKINVYIDRNDEQLECIIEDNGVGISDKKYQEIMRSLGEDEIVGESIGISNVYQRLKMYYDENFVLEIQTNKKKGITVYLRIPLNIETEM